MAKTVHRVKRLTAAVLSLLISGAVVSVQPVADYFSESSIRAYAVEKIYSFDPDRINASDVEINSNILRSVILDFYAGSLQRTQYIMTLSEKSISTYSNVHKWDHNTPINDIISADTDLINEYGIKAISAAFNGQTIYSPYSPKLTFLDESVSISKNNSFYITVWVLDSDYDITPISIFKYNLSVENEAVSVKSGYPINYANVTVDESGEVDVKGRGGITLDENDSYTLAYYKGDTLLVSKPTGAGAYKVVVTGINSYSGTVTKEFTIENAEQEASIVNSAQVIFGGNFGLKYYFTPAEYIKNDKYAYVTLEKNNKAPVTIKVSDMEKSGNYCTFRYNVVSKEICDNITLKLYNGNGEQVPLETESGIDCSESGFVYSVKQYAETIIGSAEQSKYHRLAKALIDYGNGAQIGLGYSSPDNPEPAVSSDVSDIDLSGLADYAHLRTGTKEDYDIKVIGPNVIYLDKTNYRVNYTFNKPVDINDYTVTVDGNDVKPISSTGDAVSSSWYVEIAGIQGKEYDKRYEVKLTKEGVDEPLTLNAGVLSYAKLMTEQDSAAYKTLGKAMYNYYLAEKEAFPNS